MRLSSKILTTSSLIALSPFFATNAKDIPHPLKRKLDENFGVPCPNGCSIDDILGMNLEYTNDYGNDRHYYTINNLGGADTVVSTSGYDNYEGVFQDSPGTPFEFGEVVNPSDGSPSYIRYTPTACDPSGHHHIYVLVTNDETLEGQVTAEPSENANNYCYVDVGVVCVCPETTAPTPFYEPDIDSDTDTDTDTDSLSSDAPSSVANDDAEDFGEECCCCNERSLVNKVFSVLGLSG